MHIFNHHPNALAKSSAKFIPPFFTVHGISYGPCMVPVPQAQFVQLARAAQAYA
jgi:hypothetical protein